MKLALVTSLVMLLAAGSLVALDLQQVTERHSRLLQTAYESPSTPIKGQFHEFSLNCTDSVVADTSRYALTFSMSRTSLLAAELSGFVIAFPTGFDLSHSEVGQVTDDHPELIFHIVSTVRAGSVLTIGLQTEIDSGAPVNPDTIITLSLVVADVINTTVSGQYQLAILAFDTLGDVLAGPALSESFPILPGPISTLTLAPTSDTTLAAGNLISFLATGRDAHGNAIPNPGVNWSLAPGSDPIGVFNGHTLLATKVGTGRAKATVSGISATSGLITVIPGSVARLDLRLPNQQVVGRSFTGPATVTILDAYGNRRTAHDLTTAPLKLNLTSKEGILSPTTIDNNIYISNGVVDLAAAGVFYRGPSLQTTITASIGGVFSSGAPVSLSGYDVVSVLGSDNQPLTRLPAGGISPVKAIVRNYGSLAPTYAVELSAGLAGHGGGDTATFTGHANGVPDTITLQVEVPDDDEPSDTLSLSIRSDFTLGGVVSRVESFFNLPITLTQPPALALVSPTIGPDTIYPGSAFELAFRMAATDLEAPIDSSIIRVTTADERPLFVGRVLPSATVADTLEFAGIPAALTDNQALPALSTQYRLAFDLYTSDQHLTLLKDAGPLTVLPKVALTYVPESLIPPIVAAGFQTAFQFDFVLGNEYAVSLDPSTSALTVMGSNYTASASLAGGLLPLATGVNSIQSQELFIPESQLGSYLTLSSALAVRIPSANAIDTISLGFGTETIEVRDLPITQIISLDVIAPNAPNVNTSQHFQLRCAVANLSTVAIGPVTMRLISDGNSMFDSLISFPLISANDTAEVTFGCQAAETPNSAEIFRVFIHSVAIEQIILQPPVDNIALVRIERPARLELVHSIFGPINGVIGRNMPFGLSVEIDNLGGAATGSGIYRLTTGGVSFGTADTLTGSIGAGRHIEFNFVSPGFDTTAEFHFELTTIPPDLNLAAPAEIDRTEFTFVVRVESQEVDLLVDATAPGSNLISAVQDKDLFRLDLTNRGVSSITSIRLTEISFDIRDAGGRPIDAAELFVPGRTVILENGIEVPMALTLTERLTMHFGGFIIESGETRSLLLRTGFTHSTPPTFTMSLETDDVHAVFKGGPQDGQPVLIAGANGAFLISRTFAVHGEGLKESFLIEDNPFNPLDQPALFSYDLDVNSAVEFRVFTLTGEEVFARDIPESQGAAGEHQLQWDGRNNEGDMVSNGVFIASIKVVRTGSQAVIKVAVVK